MTMPISQTPAAATAPNTPAVEPRPSDFIRDIVEKHVAEKKYPQIHTRFPPEPNGYLHIGHAKSICLNFGIASEFGGVCNLRMDDTNPTKEDVGYVDSIVEDVGWLIAGWADKSMGLKAAGTLPEVKLLGGKGDFQIAGVVGGTADGTARSEAKESMALEPFFASDYFGQMHEYAIDLIR